MGEENKFKTRQEMNRRTTLKELSVLLDLSISTVSKALKDSDEISQKTKNRVKEKAKECNYRQNKFAQVFRQGCTKSIGVIVPSIIDGFYALVITSIERYLSEKGYSMVLSVSHEFAKKEAIAIETLSAGLVDGIIISNTIETLQKKSFDSMVKNIDQGMPMVIFGRVNSQVNCDLILNDHLETAKKLTDYLISDLKIKKIALVGCQQDFINGDAKIERFLEAVKKYDLNDSAIEVHVLEDTKLHDWANSMIKNQKFESFICMDYLSNKTIDIALKELPFNSIKNIQIARLGNIVAEMNSIVEIDLNPEAIGKAAVDSILKKISSEANKEKPITKIVDANIYSINRDFVSKQYMN
jgi:LacI family transcriptional regulator